jgi:hypothetical protein
MIGVVKLLVFFQTAADLSPRTGLQRPIPAEMLRALAIHMQWLYIIGNLDVPLPQSLLYPVQVIGGIWSSTSGSSIGIECILSTTSKVPVAIQKVLICLFTPAAILLAVIAVEAILHYLRPRKSQEIGHDFASVVMCIVFMFLPTWVNTALSLFTCIPLDSPVEAPFQAEAVGSWWVEDMSQLCYSRSGYHRGWPLGLGIPLTLFFCVGLPAGVFVFMWFSRKQGKLQDMQFQKHYGFMYRLWRDERCWWESVVLLQTCALVMLSTFGFALGPFYQTMVSAAVLAWIAIALLAVRPSKCPAAGRVAVISVCVLFFTAYACLSFLPYNNAGPGSVYSNIMGAVIIVANVMFLLYAAWLLGQSVNWVAVRAWLSAGCCSNLSSMVAQDGVAGARGSSAGSLKEVRESAEGPAKLPK